MKKILLVVLTLLSLALWSQTKVSGVVVDENNEPIPFANVYFKGTSEGLITNELGKFYLESKNSHRTLVVSFVGFTPKEIELEKAVTYTMKIVLTEGEQLREVVLVSGKMSKKNNPA
ncbi:MAG: carboxypeptidase-like regulatory domain-containing protein, partial [Flavobacterium sp.]